MYESYSLAVAESSVKQNPENRLKNYKELMAGSCLGALGFGAKRSHVAGSQGFEQTGLGSWSSRTRRFAHECWASLVAQQQRIHLQYRRCRIDLWVTVDNIEEWNKL